MSLELVKQKTVGTAQMNKISARSLSLSEFLSLSLTRTRMNTHAHAGMHTAQFCFHYYNPLQMMSFLVLQHPT